MNISHSRIGKVITYLNNGLSEKNNDKKFVLFLGSSRFASAIDTKVLAEMSHVKNVTFLNLSRPSMGPWHYSVILRNSKMPFYRIKRVVLEISPWMFNRNALHPTTKKSFDYRDELHIWGTLQERMEARAPILWIKAMTIGMVRRATLLDYIAVLKEPEPIIDLVIPELDANQNPGKRLEDNPNFRAENISRCHLYKFTFLQSEADKLLELVGELDKAGIAISLVHPPVRSEYYKYLDTDFRYRSEFEKYKKFIKSFSINHQVVYWEIPSDCGLNNSIFADYGHLSKEGAILFTKRLSAEINEVIK